MTATPPSDQPLLDPNADPFPVMTDWMAQAEASEPNDPTAVALASVDSHGFPSLRMVLAKSVGRDGCVFFTNFESRKGREILANPHVALLWHWKSLRRQIRIEGIAHPVSDAEADRYFASRHPLSRLGAIASDQSRPLPDRTIFEQRVDEARARFGDDAIPRPNHWSGFRVLPIAIELWQDRPHRLHDRVRWERIEASPLWEGPFEGTRLFP